MAEIRALGLTTLEAGSALDREKLDQILALRQSGQIVVGSLHNYCPAPEEFAGTFGGNQLSSLEEIVRKAAVEYTIRTMEWAARLGAKVVVVHLGGVELKTRVVLTLRPLLEGGHRGTETYWSLVRSIMEERKALARPFLDAARRSLTEILAKLPRGIRIGLENRYNFGEIPSLEEAAQFLAEFGDSVGYWHDVGHAHALEVMGFYDQGAYLRGLGRRLIGLHLHDALGINDHKAPGTGEIDYSTLRPYLHEGVMRVLELNQAVPAEEVAKGIEFLGLKGIV